MTKLCFRLPGRALSLGAWLAELLPELERDERRRLIAEGRVRLDGQPLDRATILCPPGGRVEIEEAPGEALSPAPSRAEEAPSRVWCATVDRLPFASGLIEASDSGPLEFIELASRNSLARIRVEGASCRADQVLRALASAAMPVVGDLLRGGLAVPGGPRLEADAQGLDPSASGWPDEIAWRADAQHARAARASPEDVDAPVLRVSRQTARAIDGGHPWILPDDASDPATRFRPGSLVELVARGAGRIGWAHVEGTPRLAARVWARGAAESRAIDSVEARVARALARRRGLLDPGSSPATQAIRLVHGEADALPGLFVDRLGPLLRVLVTGWSSEAFRERAVGAILSQQPVSPEGDPWSVLELLHLRHPGHARPDRVRWIAGGVEAIAAAGFDTTGDGFWVEERGLCYAVDPGWDAPRDPRPGYGLFIDQRENRDRLADRAASGGDWLNLFAHTGAFSVALLAAGAERVVSVDLSAAYLERLERNLLGNADRGVDGSRHESRRGDVRRYLEELEPEQRFRGIVIDPPTAASAGRRFWSVKRDLAPLLGLAIERLAPGGVLLVTQNRAGPPLGLDRVIERAARRAGRSVEAIESAPPGADHPRLPGFPEGDPFEGWLLRLA